MNFDEFKQKVHSKFGLNLDGYKEKQLKRRIETLMGTQNFISYEDYYIALVKDEIQLTKFLDKVTINVSEFFRNPEIFSVLEKDIIPELIKKNGNLKIWSAACSIGCEPFTISIILDELSSASNRHRIDATDIDKKIIEKAKKGEYDKRVLKSVSAARLKKYFEQDGEKYKVIDNIKKKVNFKYHDLLKDRYDSGYNLIICRNVTIYFKSEIQDMLYKKYFDSLAKGGILFIGATENMFRYRDFGYEKISPWFYRKP